MWACIPFLQLHVVGQDVVPLVAAGQLARSDPGSIYSEVGGSTHDSNATVGRAALLAATAALKAFPLAVIAVAVVQRRWRLLAYVAAFLAVAGVVTFLLVPVSTIGSFTRTTQADASITTKDPFVDWKRSGLVCNASLLARTDGLVLFWHRRVRRLDQDAQWGYGWLALLHFVPVVWLHYRWLVVAAVLHAVRSHVASRAGRKRDPPLRAARAGRCAQPGGAHQHTDDRADHLCIQRAAGRAGRRPVPGHRDQGRDRQRRALRWCSGSARPAGDPIS